MRLRAVKLAGFKSFVDPTTITVPSHVVGIVGPNGCGKSNVIDAVRWVMGESSAKTLRGDSMADVIFNGSTARKPVGKASVELIFDNSEGSVGGPYAKFSEISMRRTLSRDGQSEYFLNRTKCRRRDITDIFLGTGLGSRSYSIIEQGMVSRIIEARPEDLRSLVEEAAGISKYKDRRRDTETRIRHTRENLLRVEDIRRELETQLRRLKRQSSAASRYKSLKQEERALQAELLSLRWQGMDEQVVAHDAQLSQLDRQLQAQIAEQRAVEREIENLRLAQGEALEHRDTVQGEFYSVGAEIATVEQSIAHALENRQQRQQELQRLQASMEEIEQHLQADQQRVAEAEQALAECGPRLAQSADSLEGAHFALATAEQTMDTWRLQWEQFGREASEPMQEREIQRARMQELQRSIEQLQTRQARLKEEMERLEPELMQPSLGQLHEQVISKDRECVDCEHAVDTLDEKMRAGRETNEHANMELDDLRERFHDVASRLQALQELNDIARGTDDDTLSSWLEQHGLAGQPRLADRIRVEPGWERAVDRILGPKLAAVCVKNLEAFAEESAALNAAELWLVEMNGTDRGHSRPSRDDVLADKVETEDPIVSGLLSGVYVADSLARAMALRPGLSDHECVVCRSGEVVGNKWMSSGGDPNGKAGMLSREAESDRLSQQHQDLERELNQVRDRVRDQQERLTAWEEERTQARAQLGRVVEDRTELHALLGREDARAAQIESRCGQIRHDIEELDSELETNHQQLVDAKDRLRAAGEQSGSHDERRDALLFEKQQYEEHLGHARGALAEVQEAKHQAEIEENRLRAALDSGTESMARLKTQRDSLRARSEELQRLVGSDDEPEKALETRLEALLGRRVEVDGRLEQARAAVAQHDESVRRQEEQRVNHDQAAEQLRSRLEQERIARQELAVRGESVEEKIQELGHRPQSLLQEMSEDAAESDWQERLEKIQGRIDRIGPVNLVAIEEYDQESERKDYLDKQHEDLSEALATLEGVIRKIDKETRARFKETFEHLNQQFQAFFPKLFGGGSAYLELSGDDWLDAGVTVMARPPGKRNSTIHLLSGGEKALTAVSLLFSFFELNPAPFCLLDEVDAPLDDANVERYSETLKSLSDRTQLIFITHNKLTMEAADLLIGVTMAEPGVSRLVAVDVERALEMAVH